MGKALVFSLAYRLFLQHFCDGLFVGVAQERHFSALFLLQLTDGHLLLIFGSCLQYVSLQSLVLPVLQCQKNTFGC